MLVKGVISMFSSYSSFIKDFKEIKVNDINQMIDNQQREIIYIGFEACPYCNYFLPKLHEVMKKYNLSFYYLNSRNIEESKEIASFRNKYNIKTVPTLFIIGEEITFRSNSEMTIEEIEDFLELS